ncbi:MAG: DNA-directed RNA polymerase subunit omega [Lachnospiraceae bacterium]|nr:DNA-directed RNA polymerase subunit omega [Lachnospiraceae bacterium]
MLHPSYTDLMRTINSEAEGDTPMVNSRYSIVLATAKRARQLIAGEEAYVDSRGKKPLSIAVEEVSRGFVTIEPETEEEEPAEELEITDTSEAEDLDQNQEETMDREEEE